MKILSKDLKHGKMALLPETLDDLWVIYNIVLPKDRVYAKTSRLIKIEDVEARPTKGRRIPVFLGVRVEKMEYQKKTDRLRFMGIVVSAPEKLNVKGSHHSINISPGKPVTILKEEWLKHDLRQIKRASEPKMPPIIVVSIDDEECCIAFLGHKGFDIKTEIKTLLPGKLDADKRNAVLIRYFKSILKSLETACKESCGLIAIVGPGFIKERFVKYVVENQPELEKRIEVIGMVSSGGIGGMHESLRSGVLEKISKKMRVIEETQAVEKILSRLGAQRRDVTYGINDVDNAINYNAVTLLLVVDDLLREAKQDERKKLEDVMQRAEKIQSKIMIVSIEHEAGKKLRGLGGIAALLRFPIV